MSHYVYKYVLNDEIIYIGKTDAKRGLKSRLNAHAHSGDNVDSKYWGELKKATIYYCELPNRVMADVVESELIRRYKPKCNKAKTSEWSGLDFVEPQWYEFEYESKKVTELRKQLAKLTQENEKLREGLRENQTAYEDLIWRYHAQYDELENLKRKGILC